MGKNESRETKEASFSSVRAFWKMEIRRFTRRIVQHLYRANDFSFSHFYLSSFSIRMDDSIVGEV